MSVVTSQPQAFVPSVSELLQAGGLPDFPRDGAVVGGARRVERRRTGRPGDSPMEVLRRMPAAVVLERLPVPSLAMGRDGIILFANAAFAEMVGYEQDALAGSVFPDVFQTVPATLCGLSGVDAQANMVVELRHCEGWTVRARMSNSALMRRGDPLILVTFDDLTERLWTDDH
jgi:PAS domain S-box-containing protein